MMSYVEIGGDVGGGERGLLVANVGGGVV